MVKEQVLFNECYFDALIEAIQGANVSIDLETYIFATDNFAKRVVEALCEAAGRGVTIRVLVDGIGTPNWGNELTLQLEKAGIETRIYHPIPWQPAQWERNSKRHSSFLWKILYSFTHVNSRNHRKTCMIDDNIIFVGSANIIECFVSSNNEKIKMRDTTVQITHVDLTEMKYAFDRAWGKMSFKHRLDHFHLKLDTSIFRLNYTLRRRMRLNRQLYKRIQHAKNRIWIINAYFVANAKLLSRLSKAAKRGIDVKILLPSQYEIPAFSLVTHSFYNLLLESGVKIYEYQPCLLHDKTMIIDDWYSVGSSNLNYRSLIHDLEVEVTIQTAQAQKKLADQFCIDLNNSKMITIEDMKNTSWLSRLAGKILLLIKYWL